MNNDVAAVIQFIFYLTISLCFSDLAFYIIRKVIRFSESLMNTKFNFGKIRVSKGSD